PGSVGTGVATPSGVIRHHFTVDVEEYFQVSAFESRLGRADWDRFESRVVGSVERLLELLARHEARATFFIVGWVAERQPELGRRIALAAHEIASHSGDHARVTDQSPLAFRDSVRRAKYVLEELAGAPVLGFRAPSFSIVPGFEWALDVLIEEGYRYDSSLFPIRRPGYGYPSALRAPHVIHRPVGQIVEFPLATTSIFRYPVPAAGGGYLRQFPLGVIRRAFREASERREPATFY